MSFRFLSPTKGPGLRVASLGFLTLAVAIAVLQTGRPACAQVAPATDDQIQRAIQKAVGRLRGTLPSLHGGESAVVAMALIKSGLPPETPEIKAAIDLILERTPTEGYVPGAHYVYEAGVSLMVLANADPVKYKRQIETIAQFLISVQRTCGAWYYFSQGDGNAGDTSITQYAVLGLWEASRAGVPVPKKVWDKVAGWHIRTQQTDGAFTYHPLENITGAFGQPGSHTMTVAGTASLLVARMHLYPDARDIEEVKTRRRRRGKKYGLLEPAVPAAENAARDTVQADIGYRPTTRLASIDKAVNSGRDWLAARFTIQPKGNWDLYYLYGLERLMALANLKELGGHDWYAEGAAQLCRVQDPGGAWHDGCGAEPATALG
ncbi:MAG: terpene cyclase/mutase family protein, partial [Planctomycetia bacterium]|nr:terpene cyclase/mutase family protein [Planctomycetia bacterium]